MKWLSEKISSNKSLLRSALIWTAIFVLVAHAFWFFNLNLSHDYMNEFYALDAKVWKISIGRFLAPLVNVLLGQYSVLPWLSGVVMIIALSLSVYLIIRMFKIEKRWQIILISGLSATSLTLVSLLASFMQDLAADMAGLVLAVLCAYEWNKLEDGFKAKDFCLGLVAVFLSLGCYQGFLPVTLSLMIVKCVENFLKQKETAKVVKHGLLGVAMVGGGALAYYATANIVSSLTGYKLTNNTTNSLSNVWDSNQSLIKRAGWTYVYTLWGLFAPSFAAIPARANLTGLSEATYQVYVLAGVNILVFIFCAILLLRYLRNKQAKTSMKVLTVLLLLVLPFAMNVMHFLSGTSHILMHYAFVIFYLLFFVFLNNSETTKFAKRGAYILGGLLAVTITINVSVANELYVKKDLETQSTAATITRVLARIEERDDYTLGETKICLIGANDVQMGVKDPSNVSLLFGAGYNSSVTYQLNNEAYLHTVLQYNAPVCATAEINEIAETATFKEMEIFPAKESIRNVNDIIVVKMSENIRW